MSRAKQLYVNESVTELKKLLANRSATLSNAAKEINKSIVMTTCAYKYIFFDPFWSKL